MIRELFISLYLLMYKCFFTIFKVFPIKNKVVFVTSFRDNNYYIYKEMQKRKFSGQMVFISKKSSYSSIKNAVDVPVFLIEQGKIIDEVKAAFHLITAKTIIVDNYYGFLAVAKFKKGVECIQVWHAAGTLKNFGYLDHAIEKRSNFAKKRFAKVYSNFHKIVVGSDLFAEIFKKAFHAKDHQFLRFGYPRTDFFYNKKDQEKRKRQFFKKYPELKKKKIILYAPTYRSNSKDNRIALDVPLLYQQLRNDYVLFIRMHPSVQLTEQIDKKYNDFVYDFTNKEAINNLLVVSDYLITDYSSIPFEYVILKKPMVFFPYDLHEYEKDPGIWGRYEKIVPGPIAFHTDEIIKYINSNEFPIKQYEEFHKRWNMYSKGRSSEKIVDYILTRHQ